MMQAIRGVAIAAAVAALGLAGCSPNPPPPDVPFLASDLHFWIGRQHIVIPAVAMRGPDHTFTLSRGPRENVKEKLKRQASDAGDPMKVETLDLSIRQYQYTGEHRASVGICPLLTRRWSAAVCRGERTGLLARLPERFMLLDRDNLDVLKNHFTVGKERRYDQVKDMVLQPGVPQIGCDKESRFCTAMVAVFPTLLATWTVESDQRTGRTAGQMTEAEGAAIVQFVRRGIGAEEDPSLVDAE
jgi:hypothetical protein